MQDHSNTMSMDKRKRTAEMLSESSSEDEAAKMARNHSSLGNKRPVDDTVEDDSKGWKLMKRMGYKEGTGLGTSEQGIAEPIRPQMQFGRSGLGRKTGLEHSLSTTWDVEQEKVDIFEMPEFFPKCSHGSPAQTELTDDGIVVGDRRLVMNDETEFCSKDILLAMLESKNVFDEVDDYQLRNARSRANPFESIRGVIFQNRAAMKMANLDAVFNFRLTNPVDSNGVSIVPKVYSNEQFFYFADICAGPGGFTEYVLWKRKWTARGFGMTLRGKDDFRLDNFLAASPEMFEPFYGAAGDGDVTKAENLDSFCKFVMQATGGRGVNLVMADGGFSVEGQENIQEILSKRLYLCQALCALMVLGKGGNFVCKLFDTFTVFTVGLLYLLWRCFDEMSIHKPHTSRPANSERYLICLSLKENVEDVKKYLYKANEQFANCKPAEDLIELVPLATLLEEAKFCEHVRSINEKLAERQTLFLRKYKAFAENPTLKDTRQDDFRSLCLQYWQIPDQSRPQRPPRSPEDALCRLAKVDPSVLRRRPPMVKLETLNACRSLSSHYVFPVYGRVTVIVSVGYVPQNGRAFAYEGNRWAPIVEDRCPLPKDTVVLGDLCYRMRSEQPTRKMMPVLRVLDAFCLDKISVDQLPYTERMKCARKLCLAVSKLQKDTRMLHLEVADGWSIKKAHEVMSQPMEQLRYQGIRYCVVQPSANSDWFYLLQQLYFLPVTKDPWSIRVGQKVEYFNNETKKCESDLLLDVATMRIVPVWQRRRFGISWLARCAMNFVIVCSILVSFAATQRLDRNQLVRRILYEYNKKLRPLSEYGKTSVAVGVFVRRIQNINEKEQTMSINAIVSMTWKDPRLSWNQTMYNASSSITIKPYAIWQPDLTIFNAAKTEEAVLKYWNIPATVTRDGVVAVSQEFRFTISCKFDFFYFPFDQQSCSAVLSAWMYDATEIDWSWMEGLSLKTAGFHQQDYNRRSKHGLASWQLVNTTYRRLYWSPSGYTDSLQGLNQKEVWTAMVVDLKVKRQRPYFYIADALPNFIFALLTLFAFWIEDMNVVLAIIMLSLLGQAMFSWGILKQLPPASGKTPRIAAANGFNFAITGFVLIAHILLPHLKSLSAESVVLVRLLDYTNRWAIFKWKGIRWKGELAERLMDDETGADNDKKAVDVSRSPIFLTRRALFLLVVTTEVLFIFVYLLM
ncbi:hypothetical protein M513_10010 [Trichuris suis]|uniref:Cap-specific mRNA (nucleoside-2'-O-)-methyltransferase 1 n=1 Tax=Trichuris suis TaxID=68888 RepID=A0A085LVS2_9BILA|nr:hypothetical protein M513_10010 [Trichuris suis]